MRANDEEISWVNYPWKSKNQKNPVSQASHSSENEFPLTNLTEMEICGKRFSEIQQEAVHFLGINGY